MLTDTQVAFLREELATAKNPLFLYDDDADGLCSFVLLYRLHREGKGFILKASSTLTKGYLRALEEYQPDKVFVLDIPLIEQEFIDGAARPLFWLDHHQPQQHQNVHYFNPRLSNPDAYVPTTYLAWQISQREEDLWIAAVGCLADWYWPDFMDKVKKRYPQLLSPTADLRQAVSAEPIGKLVKMFFFLLKGPSSEVRKGVKILTRLQSPDELLQQTTPQGNFLSKRFENINQKYEQLLAQAKEKVTRSKVLLFSYTEQEWSFTANLANELAILYPEKVILVARKKSGEMKCSLRAPFSIIGQLQRALLGIRGSGGGHPQACGVVVKEEDWAQFLQNLRREVG